MGSFHFIKDEMLVHIPICTHAEPKRVLVVGGCDNIKNELGKYKIFDEIVHIDIEVAKETLESMDGKKFDVAIVADDRFATDREFWIELTKRLDEKGVVSSLAPDLALDIQKSKESYKMLGAIYGIVMPYRYEKEVDAKLECGYMTLCSRFYHPTADINLQRADLTDGFRYYNSDIAVAAFQMPTFIFKEYLGIIKR